jgi:hypothetical protein
MVRSTDAFMTLEALGEFDSDDELAASIWNSLLQPDEDGNCKHDVTAQ